MSFSNKLKEIRKEQGYTLLELAGRVGVSEATVQRWESGNIKNIKYDHIMKLSEVLGIGPSVLMGWTNEDAPKTIAAHHDSTQWTEEELNEIEEFKRYVLSKRKK